MSLCNRSKPLNQPPGFRRVGHTNTHSALADTPEHHAARALQASQHGRELAVSRQGGRRAVVRE